MNIRYLSVLIVIGFLTVSCDSDKVRLEFMEEKLGLQLPEKFEQIENSTNGYIDFEIKIKLKFQLSDYLEIHSHLLSRYEEVNKVDGLYYLNDYSQPAEPIHCILDSANKIVEFSFVHL